MATYCAKFIPNFSDVSQPLRELTRKDTPFQWNQEYDQSFHNNTVMAYFDQAKETELITDASPWELSAILSQKTPSQEDRKIVVYVSRSLTDTEKQYSQTEKEALAIVWAIERLHLYLYGAHFTLYTYCKPIQLISHNAKSKPPAHIERWNLRLQGYDFTMEHTKGTLNPSDFLSQHPSPYDSDKPDALAEDYVNFIINHAVPKALSLSETQQAAREDNTLQYLAKIITQNKWELVDRNEKESQSEGVELNKLKLFSRVKDELTVNGEMNIILRDTRIVVPTSLHQKAIELAHEGHQGLVKTKKLLREKVWFPRIDEEVKLMIDRCIPCQANGLQNRPDPLQMSPLLPEPWHTIHIDFCGPFPTGEYLFVIIDAYSRYPEVEIVHSTSAKAIIPKMDRVFATHGIPRVIRSDNGPPFSSEEIRQFMQENDIEHKRITPLWPQANSEAENFMKPVTKAIRSARVEGREWKKDLYQFLLNYRATPHSTTGFTPSELLFNRKIRTKLPQMVIGSDQSKVQQNDDQAKKKMKEYADANSKAKQADIRVGDTVLIRQRKENKWSTKFDPSPFRVVRRKGTMITVIRKGKYVSRNIVFFKKIVSMRVESDMSDDEEEVMIQDSGPVA